MPLDGYHTDREGGSWLCLILSRMAAVYAEPRLGPSTAADPVSSAAGLAGGGWWRLGGLTPSPPPPESVSSHVLQESTATLTRQSAVHAPWEFAACIFQRGVAVTRQLTQSHFEIRLHSEAMLWCQDHQAPRHGAVRRALCSQMESWWVTPLMSETATAAPSSRHLSQRICGRRPRESRLIY